MTSCRGKSITAEFCHLFKTVGILGNQQALLKVGKRYITRILHVNSHAVASIFNANYVLSDTKKPDYQMAGNKSTVL